MAEVSEAYDLLVAADGGSGQVRGSGALWGLWGWELWCGWAWAAPGPEMETGRQPAPRMRAPAAAGCVRSGGASCCSGTGPAAHPPRRLPRPAAQVCEALAAEHPQFTFSVDGIEREYKTFHGLRGEVEPRGEGPLPAGPGPGAALRAAPLPRCPAPLLSPPAARQPRRRRPLHPPPPAEFATRRGATLHLFASEDPYTAITAHRNPDGTYSGTISVRAGGWHELASLEEYQEMLATEFRGLPRDWVFDIAEQAFNSPAGFNGARAPARLPACLPACLPVPACKATRDGRCRTRPCPRPPRLRLPAAGKHVQVTQMAAPSVLLLGDALQPAPGAEDNSGDVLSACQTLAEALADGGGDLDAVPRLFHEQRVQEVPALFELAPARGQHQGHGGSGGGGRQDVPLEARLRDEVKARQREETRQREQRLAAEARQREKARAAELEVRQAQQESAREEARRRELAALRELQQQRQREEEARWQAEQRRREEESRWQAEQQARQRELELEREQRWQQPQAQQGRFSGWVEPAAAEVAGIDARQRALEEQERRRQREREEEMRRREANQRALRERSQQGPAGGQAGQAGQQAPGRARSYGQRRVAAPRRRPEEQSLPELKQQVQQQVRRGEYSVQALRQRAQMRRARLVQAALRKLRGQEEEEAAEEDDGHGHHHHHASHDDEDGHGHGHGHAPPPPPYSQPLPVEAVLPAPARRRVQELRHQLHQVASARERYARRQEYRKLSLQQREEFRKKNEAERAAAAAAAQAQAGGDHGHNGHHHEEEAEVERVPRGIQLALRMRGLQLQRPRSFQELRHRLQQRARWSGYSVQAVQQRKLVKQSRLVQEALRKLRGQEEEEAAEDDDGHGHHHHHAAHDDEDGHGHGHGHAPAPPPFSQPFAREHALPAAQRWRMQELRRQAAQVNAALERYARRQQYRKLSLQQRDEFRRKNEAERASAAQMQALLDDLAQKVLGGAKLPGGGSPVAVQVVQMLGGTKAEAEAAAEGSGSAVVGFLAALASKAAGLI